MLTKPHQNQLFLQLQMEIGQEFEQQVVFPLIDSAEVTLAPSHIETPANDSTKDEVLETTNSGQTEEIIDVDSDLEFAKALDQSINGSLAMECDSDLEFAQKLQEKYDKEASSQMPARDDDVIDVTEPLETVEILDEDDIVVVENSYETAGDVIVTGASTIKFVIEELGITYNPASSFDWKRHEMKLNISAIFKKFTKLYFNDASCFANIEIGWSTHLGNKPAQLRLLPDKTQISLNTNLMLVPRIDLITHLLRIMLILFIRQNYGLDKDVGAFKRNFIKALSHINKTWLTHIQDSSVVTFNHEIDKRCWYRCSGICQNHSPFYGIFRSNAEPGGQCSWWLQHRTNCGATLFRLYEVTKYVDNSPVPEDNFFVTNVKHRSVKVDLRIANKKFLKPTETIDLASGESTITPSNSCIDIDDLHRRVLFESQRRPDNYLKNLGFKPADEFIQFFDRSLGVDFNGYLLPCPLCQEKVNRRLFGEHFDGCMGFSKKVQYKPVSSKWEEWPDAKRMKN